MKRLFNLLRDTTSDTSSSLLDPRLSKKIRNACAAARAAGYQFLWMDACCIDRSSSSELSEAINSMYEWYEHAAICFAFLCDVDDGEDPDAAGSTFRTSRWFKRGWTLQELIAPPVVVFLSKNWHYIGTKATLGTTIAGITTIPSQFLNHQTPLIIAGVAQRFSWAASRATTYEEDESYSLMGLFGINMPVLYGEGRYAFIRLQEHILRESVYDQSIFAWNRDAFGIGPSGYVKAPRLQDLRRAPHKAIHTSMIWTTREGVLHSMTDPKHVLATCPADFANCFGTVGLHPQLFEEELGMRLPIPSYTSSSFGLRTQLPMFPIDVLSAPSDREDSDVERRCQWYIAVLACHNTLYYSGTHFLGIICGLPVHAEDDESPGSDRASEDAIPVLFGGTHVTARSRDGSAAVPINSFRLVVLTLADIKTVRSSIRVMEVFIPMRPSHSVLSATQRLRRSATTLVNSAGGNVEINGSVELAPWSLAILHAREYTLVPLSPVLSEDGTEMVRAFALTKEGISFLVNYVPHLSYGPHGASVAIRVPLFFCADGLDEVREPILKWRPWRLLTEATPAVWSLSDSRCDARALHLSLTYHAQDLYLLGIEIMGSDDEEKRSMLDIVRRSIQNGTLQGLSTQEDETGAESEDVEQQPEYEPDEEVEVEELNSAELDDDLEEQVRIAAQAVARALLVSLSTSLRPFNE